MTAQAEQFPPRSREEFLAVLRPIRGFHAQYIESDGFRRAKDAIRELNRQYAVTEMIEIILDTASYQIPDSLRQGGVEQYESPATPRLEDGRLFYAAAAIVCRGLPTGKKALPFDEMDRRLYDTFNSNISPHNALHLLDAANEKDIEFMENRLRAHRIAQFHGNPPLLTEVDEYNLELDLAGRELKRANIRGRVIALREEHARLKGAKRK